MPKLESKLFIVTDRRQTNGRPLVPLLDRALSVGTCIVHLRERDLSTKELLALARDVQSVASQRGSQFVINDRIDVALSLEGVGVHLRGNSLPLPVARRLVGPDRVLGQSVHSVDEAVRAASQGADYVVLGPLYETPSKVAFGPPLGLHAVREASGSVRIPVIGIGGITSARAGAVCDAGAFGVAVIAAIFGADDIEAATRAMLDAVTAES